MAYDETLAARVRDILSDQFGVVEKKMFGGLAFMWRGNMTVGITNEGLMVRVGKENNEKSLAYPHTRPMDFTGKPMKGFIYVAPEGVATDDDLRAWVGRGVAFSETLPAK
ncbi:MAG: TfoX/Sxy family protein [Caldilineaceae bacterium]|nr:TfoX/Sxy family protein [Caldilineaceae bacterium]